jgi:phage repressor protein C with HTH and peptisase S24 domain
VDVREAIRWYSSYLIQTSHAVDARVKGDSMVPVVSNTDELLPVVDVTVLSGGCKRETNTKATRRI